MFRYHWGIIIMIISMGAIFGALIMQYGFGIAPCELCYYQRYLWIATFIVASLAWLFRKKKSYQVILLIATALLLFASFGVGMHQTGTIYAWWGAIVSCEASVVDFDGLNAFDPANTGNLSFTPSCSSTDQLIFNIPISLLNAFVAIICLFYLAFCIKFIYLKKLVKEG